VIRLTFPTRRGMTLTELLIVVAIIGLLAVTVLPSLATTTESRRTREAASVVSGLCARAQSTAIGKQDWAGMLIASENNSTGALDVRFVSVPPPYTGATLNAKLAVQTGITTTGATNIALAASACPVASGTSYTNAPQELSDFAAAGVGAGDLLQFDGAGPVYELASITTGSIQFQIRQSGSNNAGFTTMNQPWPASTPATHTFEIFRKPVRGGPTFPVPNGRVIDMGWSGHDNPPSAYERFNANGEQVSVLFDTTGRMRLIMRGTSRTTPQYPVYFLIGRPDRIGNQYSASLSLTDDSLGANWQYADSWWIAIDPLTGTVRSAECTPNATSVTESQTFIRH
jgi:prepilin-type N-terminal cleavage/methylation domain-containing protein